MSHRVTIKFTRSQAEAAVAALEQVEQPTEAAIAAHRKLVKSLSRREIALTGEDRDPLPMETRLKWLDLFGIDPDYCGGEDVDVWLEKHRGGA